MKPIGRDTPPRAQNRSAGQQARLNKTESKNRRQPFKTVGSGFGAPGGIRTHGLPLRSLAFLLVRYTHHNFPLFLIRYDIVWLLVNLHKNP